MGILAEVEALIEKINPQTILSDLDSVKAKVAEYETRIQQAESVGLEIAKVVIPLLTAAGIPIPPMLAGLLAAAETAKAA